MKSMSKYEISYYNDDIFFICLCFYILGCKPLLLIDLKKGFRLIRSAQKRNRQITPHSINVPNCGGNPPKMRLWFSSGEERNYQKGGKYSLSGIILKVEFFLSTVNHFSTANIEMKFLSCRFDQHFLNWFIFECKKNHNELPLRMHWFEASNACGWCEWCSEFFSPQSYSI